MLRWLSFKAFHNLAVRVGEVSLERWCMCRQELVLMAQQVGSAVAFAFLCLLLLRPKWIPLPALQCLNPSNHACACNSTIKGTGTHQIGWQEADQR